MKIILRFSFGLLRLSSRDYFAHNPNPSASESKIKIGKTVYDIYTLKFWELFFSTKYWEKYTILCKLYTFYNISYSFVYSHYHFLFISSDIASVSDICICRIGWCKSNWYKI